MGRFLHKLGELFYSQPWKVIGAWVAILAVFGVVASTQFKAPSNSISIPGTPADSALTELTKLFPDAGKGTGRVVVKAPDGKKVADFKPQIEQISHEMSEVAGVKSVYTPFMNEKAISKNGTIAIIQVQLAGGVGEVSADTTKAVEAKVRDLRKAGLTAEMGGDITQKAPSEMVGIGEVFGLLIAIAVLCGVFRTVRLAGLPVIVAILTVGVAMAGLFMFSKIIDVSATTPVLAIMLGLAVGIDYSLFIVNKYLRLVRDGMKPKEAAGRANGTAGNAVLFAAATVVIALAALMVVNIPFMTTMGLAGAATIALAGIVAVTLVPALLGLVAKRIPKQVISTEKSHKARHKFAYAWVHTIAKRPFVSLLTGVLIAVAIAWPVQHIQLGLPLDEHASKKTTERKAYDLVSEGFGQGYNSPLAVVVQDVPAVTTEQEARIKMGLMEQFKQQVAAEQAKAEATFGAQMTQITSPEQLMALQQQMVKAQQEGEAKQKEALAKIEYGAKELAKRENLQKIADGIKKRENVSDVQVGLVNGNGTAGVIQVVPSTTSFDAKTTQLVHDLRDTSVQKTLSNFNGLKYGVTGSTALQLDINKKLSDALPVYLLVAVGLSFVILMIAFRSILVPLKATLGFILSVLAMFGALVAVFQWGWFGIAEAPGPIISFIPIIATGILFGLAMDYEFFLVSSMHEAHAHGMDAKKAVVEGFSHSSRVVVAAALIMIAVFGGFIFNHDATVQAIGFGLAVGIFVDAFIVRLLIVPAVMLLVGKSMWWLPSWLDKVLPKVSIEGEE